MKKLLRRLGRYLLLAILFLIGIVLVNTFTFSSRRLPVDPVLGVQVPDAAFSRLAEAVRYPTISTETGIDTAAFVGIDTFLRKQFPRVHESLSLKIVNGYSRLYQWPGTNPKLAPVLLLAHLDVVPVESESRSAWQVDPFGGVQKDGYLWGRGTLDDKINALGILEAVELLLSDDFRPARSVYLAFGHDEEVGGNGAQAMAAYFADEGITFEYVLDEGSLIIEDALPGLGAPLAMIGLSEKGYLSLELRAHLPEGGHSSMPPPETAIGLLSEAIYTLQENPFPARINGSVRSMFEYVGPEMSFPFKAVFANMWLTKGLLKAQFSNRNTTSAMIRTTTAPTIVRGGVKDNVLPMEARAVINFRILPGETTKTVTERVRNLIKDDRITVTPTEPFSGSDPAPVSETSAFGFQVIHRTIREIFPQIVVAPSLVIGATDSRHYVEVADQTYRFMPVQVSQEELSGIHGINERVSLDNYRHTVQWYYRLLENSCR